MEHWFLSNIAVFNGPVKPRTVQTLAMRGVTCGVFTQTDAAPGVWIFEDTDGTKLLAFVPENAAGATAEAARAALEALPETMPDIPLYRIPGKPDDSALTRPANGVLRGKTALYVNAANVALKRMDVNTDGAVLELCETAGKETVYELYCEELDFGFRALFAPWEIKRFAVGADGSVTEDSFDR